MEKRLTDQMVSLSTERDRLNGLNADLQRMMNDKDHSEADSRRRLQTQIETLESEMQTLRKRINEEVEESKRVTFRREYESQQSTARIEELMGTLSTVREELIAAQTTRDHLQSRVSELTIELRSAQDTIEVYRPKPNAEKELESADNTITKAVSYTHLTLPTKRIV